MSTRTPGEDQLTVWGDTHINAVGYDSPLRVAVPYYETAGRYGYAAVGDMWHVFHVPSGEQRQPVFFHEDEAQAQVIELEQTPHIFPDDMPPSLVEAFKQVMWFICPDCLMATGPENGQDDSPLCDSCWGIENRKMSPW